LCCLSPVCQVQIFSFSGVFLGFGFWWISPRIFVMDLARMCCSSSGTATTTNKVWSFSKLLHARFIIRGEESGIATACFASRGGCRRRPFAGISMKDRKSSRYMLELFGHSHGNIVGKILWWVFGIRQFLEEKKIKTKQKTSLSFYEF
jgi:hypothetical protein